MTTDSSPAIDTAVKRFAARQLGLRQTASPESRHIALLNCLRDNNFLPPPHWQQAVEVLRKNAAAASGKPPPAALLVNYEQRLRGTIERFARSFFKMPTTERRDRWNKLLRRVATFPRLEARLRALEPGLSFDVSQLGKQDLPARRLTQYACKLFVLRPQARAIRRQALLRSLAENTGRPAISVSSRRGAPKAITKWETAARVVSKRDPQVAALAPELFEQLATWTKRHKRRAKVARLARLTVITKRKNESREWSSPVLLLMLLVIVGALRPLLQNNSSPTSPPRRPPISNRDLEKLFKEELNRDLPAILNKKPEDLTAQDRTLMIIYGLEEAYVKKHGERARPFIKLGSSHGQAGPAPQQPGLEHEVVPLLVRPPEPPPAGNSTLLPVPAP